MSGFGKIALTLFVFFGSAGSLHAEESASITETMSTLVLQIGIIVFVVRFAGRLVKKIRVPQVLGELLAGIIIGPYALGGISLPGFPQGFFPLGEGLAVSPELYGFATVASIILLFASGLETDLALFLRYSIAGGVIGIGGVLFTFLAGDVIGMAILKAPFLDPRCLFMGILATPTSVGITARILSDHKKMDSPEGVTVLAAAVFDDVLGIIFLAVVLGIVAVLSGHGTGESLNSAKIITIAVKAFGIWLGFTALGLIFAKRIAAFLKLFKHSYDFSILGLGLALLLAGLFERQGLAMIIGAYVAGLSLSKTDIAAVIQERIRGLYEFFVPLFFAVMGMMVNLKELASSSIILFGLMYTVAAIIAKVLGCGGPALALGFNAKGAIRIGIGMVPRGEVVLIIAGIGLTAGILDNSLFSISVLMTLITAVLSPPLLNMVLKLPGTGTRGPSKGADSATLVWDFPSDEIADLVVDSLLKDLKSEGFYVQMMNIDAGLSQARKDDISLSITEDEKRVTVVTAHERAYFAKTAVYEVIVKLHEAMERLKSSSDPASLRKELLDADGGTDKDVLKTIDPARIITQLKADTKKGVIEELVALLDKTGKLYDVEIALADVLQREKTMSTGMQHGVALPHGKSDGARGLAVAIGLKKEGIDFESMDGEPSKIFILVVSPKKTSGPHIQFLAAISALLKDDKLRERLLSCQTGEEAASLLRQGKA